MVNDHVWHWKALIAELVVFGADAAVVVDDHHCFSISPVATRKVVPAAAAGEDDEVGEIVVSDVVADVEHPLRHYPPRRQPLPLHPLPPH